MTADDFRRIALTLPEAKEGAHMGHPDFRLRGKIFATLSPPGQGWGMAKLTPEQQRMFIRSDPAVFAQVKGTWGERGATRVLLDRASELVVRRALVAAWRNLAPDALADELEDTD